MIDEINNEFNRLNNSDKSFLARSWDGFKRWVKGLSILSGIISSALWEAIKRLVGKY